MTDKLTEWKKYHLDPVSPSFCAAKWYNASIHLGSGYTSSCHLPLPHLVDKEEIKNNPSALHNTSHKKQMRKMMLEGKRPAECSYCWKIEDINRNNISDRVHKSIIYDVQDVKLIKNIPWDQDVDLKRLEISFDRQCNFACSYCSAGYSTTWSQDLTRFGAYQNFIAPNGGGGAYQTDGDWAEEYGKKSNDNPYMNAFFEWWPKLSKTLTELRITGGEATVSQNFWRFVDLMHNSDSHNMRFAVNTNMGLTKKALDKLIKITHTLPIKEFDLFTSNESYGEHAEYIRDGLNYKLWKNNLIRFLSEAKYRSVTIMMTINQLCLFSITEFIDDMLELKERFNNKIYLSLNILRWPGFMSPLVLPENIKLELFNKIKIWFDNNQHNKFLVESEKSQIQRLLDYISVYEVHDDNNLLFHDFKSFFTQYDLRRNKDFLKTFPELKTWYENIELNKNFEFKKMDIKAGITPPETGEYLS